MLDTGAAVRKATSHDDSPVSTTVRRDAELASLPRVEALYRQHFPAAVRLAYLLTGDASAAEDLAQDAFLAAAPRLFGLSSPDAFASYLRRTVARGVLMRARGADRESNRWQRAADGSGETTIDQTVGAAVRIDVVTALRRLPVKQRTAVVLRYWADLTEEDIAIVLRCRRGTVKSTLSRALDTLRRDFGDHGRS